MKTLIVYFSRKDENYVQGQIKHLEVGNTEVMANMIQKATNASMVQIKTLQRYPSKYQPCTQVAQKELQEQARPAILNDIVDMDSYDTIFLGYPNWWNTMPMAVFHFIEKHSFDGKTIVPFCTHEGSGFGNSIQDLQQLCPSANLKKGLAIRGGEVQNKEAQINQWMKGLEESL